MLSSTLCPLETAELTWVLWIFYADDRLVLSRKAYPPAPRALVEKLTAPSKRYTGSFVMEIVAIVLEELDEQDTQVLTGVDFSVPNFGM
jgi:hypothetical protein